MSRAYTFRLRVWLSGYTAVEKKSKESSLKKICTQDQTEEKRKGKNDEKVVDSHVSDAKADGVV